MATMSTGPPLRVAVAAEQALVSEAVRTALRTRAVDPVSVRWPGQELSATLPRPRGRSRPPVVGLLVSDLDKWARLRGARLLISRIAIPWVVITAAERGPMWGAVVDVGARAVLPSSTSLDEIIATLEQVHSGAEPIPEAERLSLAAEWTEFLATREELGARLRSLTPREREVLRLLYLGESVARIAELLEVSPATVRSQVKSVLRKLDVNSQLGAVALLGDLSRLIDGDLLGSP